MKVVGLLVAHVLAWMIICVIGHFVTCFGYLVAVGVDLPTSCPVAFSGFATICALIRLMKRKQVGAALALGGLTLLFGGMALAMRTQIVGLPGKE